MKQADHESAATLATTLLHKNMSEIYATAEKKPDLAAEWLTELLAAWRHHQSKCDLLIEAIEDVRTALRHTRPSPDNVVSIDTLRSRSRAAR